MAQGISVSRHFSISVSFPYPFSAIFWPKMAFCSACGNKQELCSCSKRSRSRERSQGEAREKVDEKQCQIHEQAGGLGSLLDKAAERNRQHVKEENRAMLTEFLSKSEAQSKAIAKDMAADLRKEFLTEIGKIRSELAPKAEVGSSACSDEMVKLRGDFVKLQSMVSESSPPQTHTRKTRSVGARTSFVPC